MGDIFKGELSDSLCPGGVWTLSDSMRRLLDRQMAQLPRNRDTSEHETRYPATLAGMRAFLRTFFTRHLCELQNSLVGYIATADFCETKQSGSLRILDIGSGPAVASLALTDMTGRLAQIAEGVVGRWSTVAQSIHVLNDTSPVCLAVGRHMLSQHLRQRGTCAVPLSHDKIFTVLAPFPRNMRQIRRLASAVGGYDMIFLSYMMHPLTESCRLPDIVRGVNALESLCRPTGRILILQDRFQEALLRHIARMLGVECHEQTVTQEIYPRRGENETYTYTYYDCLFRPRQAETLRGMNAMPMPK